MRLYGNLNAAIERVSLLRFFCRDWSHCSKAKPPFNDSHRLVMARGSNYARITHRRHFTVIKLTIGDKFGAVPAFVVAPCARARVRISEKPSRLHSTRVTWCQLPASRLTSRASDGSRSRCRTWHTLSLSHGYLLRPPKSSRRASRDKSENLAKRAFVSPSNFPDGKREREREREREMASGATVKTPRFHKSP